MNRKVIILDSGPPNVRLATEEEIQALMKQEREQEQREKAEALAMMTAAMSAISTPYMDMPYPHIPKHSHSRHTAGVVYCHVCRNGGITLYKDGSNYICRECRKKVTR